jgi:UPF0755 protein
VKAKLLLLAVLALVAAVGFIGFAWWGPGPSDTPVKVVIERGSSLARASYKLEEAGAVRSAGLFRRLAGQFGRKSPVKYGEYEVPAGASAEEILRLLQGGEALQYRITIPEGMPSILVHERLMATPGLTGTVAVAAEGSILPDTYSFERDEPRAKVQQRMQAAMTGTLADLWKDRKASTVVKSPKEAIILASIVEKETGKAAERRIVAGVYSNRLRIGMKLDADPTVIYPITKGKPLGRRIRRSELRRDTGYNTYLKPGLPAGPIANPGRASIAAVLDPEPTKALYFVADGTGGHVFANTLPEQNANVAKWRAIRRARGEM